MNRYQRNVIDAEPGKEFKNKYSTDLCCDQIEDGIDLPERMLNAVENGDLEMLRDYLERDCNINAKHGGESLLSRACGIGQHDVLQMLLQYPNIHMNVQFGGKTPIDRASCNGHLEVVVAILNSEVKCVPHLISGWRSIVMALKQKASLKNHAAVRVFCWAAHEGQWDAVETILQRNFHIHRKFLYTGILQAIHQDRWDIVSQIFKIKFHRKDEILMEILNISVKFRHWHSIWDILGHIDENLKMDEKLVEAALDKMTETFDALLAKVQHDSLTLNGSFLIVAAGGTSEVIVQKLMAFKDTYTKRTFSDALCLAAIGKHSEMFFALLTHPESNYSLHDIYRPCTIIRKFSSHDGYIMNDHIMHCLNNLVKRKVAEAGLVLNTR